jgi:hypothetical protein
MAVLTWQPAKKPKGQPLNVEAKHVNALLASVRIVVEHILAGVKRCRNVKDTLRPTKAGFSDSVMELACALHNLRAHFRQPVPTLNILDFHSDKGSQYSAWLHTDTLQRPTLLRTRAIA